MEISVLSSIDCGHSSSARLGSSGLLSKHRREQRGHSWKVTTCRVQGDAGTVSPAVSFWQDDWQGTRRGNNHSNSTPGLHHLNPRAECNEMLAQFHRQQSRLAVAAAGSAGLQLLGRRLLSCVKSLLRLAGNSWPADTNNQQHNTLDKTKYKKPFLACLTYSWFLFFNVCSVQCFQLQKNLF